MKILKNTLLTYILFLTGNIVIAQNLSKGDHLINASIGLSNLVRPQGFETTLPPLVFQFEYALTNRITVGTYLGISRSLFEDQGYFSLYKYPYNIEHQTYHWTATNILAGIKGAYHFGELLKTTEKLDLYIGATFGYNIVAVKIKQTEGSINLNPYLTPEPKTKAMGGVFFGTRYYLTKKIALMGEIGYSTAIFQVGISYKL